MGERCTTAHAVALGPFARAPASKLRLAGPADLVGKGDLPKEHSDPA